MASQEPKALTPEVGQNAITTEKMDDEASSSNLVPPEETPNVNVAEVSKDDTVHPSANERENVEDDDRI